MFVLDYVTQSGQPEDEQHTVSVREPEQSRNELLQQKVQKLIQKMSDELQQEVQMLIQKLPQFGPREQELSDRSRELIPGTDKLEHRSVDLDARNRTLLKSKNKLEEKLTELTRREQEWNDREIRLLLSKVEIEKRLDESKMREQELSARILELTHMDELVKHEQAQRSAHLEEKLSNVFTTSAAAAAAEESEVREQDKILELTENRGEVDKLVEHEQTHGSVHLGQRLSTVKMTKPHDSSVTSAAAAAAHSALGTSTAG